MGNSMKSTSAKNSIFKKMLQSLTFPRGGGRRRLSTSTTPAILPRSVSCPPTTAAAGTSRASSKTKIPHGCFSVYVGEERQKFAVKTECANHPLFRMLLEDAETEYGFTGDGPLVIPCDVDLFYKVLAEMDGGRETDPGCGSCSPFMNPGRHLGKSGDLGKGYGSYGVLTPPSRWLKINHY